MNFDWYAFTRSNCSIKVYDNLDLILHLKKCHFTDIFEPNFIRQSVCSNFKIIIVMTVGIMSH